MGTIFIIYFLQIGQTCQHTKILNIRIVSIKTTWIFSINYKILRTKYVNIKKIYDKNLKCIKNTIHKAICIFLSVSANI